MKKLYYKTIRYDVTTKRYGKLYDIDHSRMKYVYIEENQAKDSEKIFKTFEDYPVDKWLTEFRKKPYFNIDWCTKIYKSNFKEGTELITYTKVKENSVSFEFLMKNLSALEFIAYCKDKGLTICPMSK